MSCRKHYFFRCPLCGNFVGTINYSGNKMICCGQEMEEVVANTVDASVEKHVPQYEKAGNTYKVVVGSVIHPSLPEHHIEWIYLQTCCGGHRVCVKIGEEPRAEFTLSEGEEPVAVYEYCNLHGLWKKDII